MHGAAGFLLTALIRVLEAMFAIGAVGSALVIIFSTVDDVKSLRGKD